MPCGIAGLERVKVLFNAKGLFNVKVVLNVRTWEAVGEGDAKESDLGAASLHIGGELHKYNVSHIPDTV
jgi:hypothetical protein